MKFKTERALLKGRYYTTTISATDYGSDLETPGEEREFFLMAGHPEIVFGGKLTADIGGIDENGVVEGEEISYSFFTKTEQKEIKPGFFLSHSVDTDKLKQRALELGLTVKAIHDLARFEIYAFEGLATEAIEEAIEEKRAEIVEDFLAGYPKVFTI